jgi:hypothetical protein
VFRLIAIGLLILSGCESDSAYGRAEADADLGALDGAGMDTALDVDGDLPSEDGGPGDTPDEDTGELDVNTDGSDGGEDTDPDTGDEVPPIEAPADTWTWIDIPGTQCADGSPTGLGINVHPGATRLYIYLEGGGACWDYNNCFGLVSTALHLDGFDADTFESVITDVYLNSLSFDRDDPKNVLRDAHHVFLPYCTADIFAGDAVRELEGAFGRRRTIYFKGRMNMAAYLRHLVPTFPDVEHVIVAGSSAGGFGAAVSWPAVRAAFPGRRVDVIDDSGPPVDPADGMWEEWVEIWNLAIPPDCDRCGESVRALRNYFRRYFEEGDGSRMAILSYTRDSIISTFMGLWPVVFEERVRAMCEEFGDEPSAQCFLVGGGLHTFLLAGMDNESGGLPLWRWIELMIEGDEDWDTAVP